MEDEIYEYLLKNCIGKNHLVKNFILRRMFNINSDKSLRQVIQNIRENKKYKRVVGSVSGKSGGYYICCNKQEIEETINNIKHRANQMLRMTHIIKWKKRFNNDICEMD